MNTRRYPRSLVEAFGPYAAGQIEPMPDAKETDYPKSWWAAIFVICLLAIAVIYKQPEHKAQPVSLAEQCPGGVPVWLDDNTIECRPRKVRGR